jgi:DNA (cytosine-5)-methyltransferase 1
MNHGSLFSGIGGFDLASEWMGWDNKFHCEWNDFGQKILKHYWPKAESYGDITTTDFTIWNGKIDILTGGFPCQPYSQAGSRLGKEDERHLWPEMLRAIKEIKPRWVVGENVYGIVNWSEGLVFEEVQAQLEDAGYTVQPYILPAAGVNAPHQRYRVWFVAYSKCSGHRGSAKETRDDKQERIRGVDTHSGWDRGEVRSETERCGETTANTISSGCKRQGEQPIPTTQERTFDSCNSWDNFPTQPPICSRDDGLPTKLDRITFPKWRNESIKGYGNAIVPQVAYQLFKTITDYENT